VPGVDKYQELISPEEEGMKGRFLRRAFMAACLGLMLGCGAAFAEENVTVPESGAFTLGEIEVIEQTDGSPNVSVQRVSEQTMRKFDANTVSAAVNLVPGVTLSKVGARNEMMVYVRGLDSKHVPLFLDGIPIYVPYDGYPDLSRFNTFDLANITVSKGFASVLYGPNTMAGAINLVTKRPAKEFEATVGVGAGSDMWHSYMNLGTNQGLWYLQTSFSHLDMDTYPLSGDYNEGYWGTESGGSRENAYSEDTKGSIRIGLTPNTTDEYALTYISQHGKKETPPYAGDDPATMPRYWRWPYWDKESVYLNSETWFLNDNYVKTRLYYDEFENSLFAYDDETYSSMKKKSSFKSAYDDHTLGASIEIGTYALPMQELKAAFHYKKDYHSEQAPATPDVEMEEDVYSVGLEDTIHVTESFYVIAGVSYDYISTKYADNLVGGVISDFPVDNADAINPQLALFYKVSPEGLAHASVAMKSRLPSIKDKFSYRLGKAIPNPELDPERSVNYEVGYKHSLDWLTVEGNVFWNDISDYILFKDVPNPTNPATTVSQNQNIGEVDIYGLELGVTAALLESLTIGTNYTYLEYENHTNDDELTNTPSHKVFTYVEYRPWERLSFLADMEHNSDRFSSTDGVRVAEGYTIFGVKATYEFMEKKFIEAGMNNVFDRDYAIDEGYPEPGQTWFANLRMEF
jgi:iron complex outermembrane receptor protein